MRFTTTDGKDYEVADQCPYCSLSTGGQHGAGCPMADRKFGVVINFPNRLGGKVV